MKTVFSLNLKDYGSEGLVDLREMENGEKRLKVELPECSFMTTSMSSESQGSWNNAHSHNSLLEVIIVKKGFMVWAVDDKKNNKIILKKFRAGESFHTPANRVPHCAYVSPDTELIVVVYQKWKAEEGNPEKDGYDWWPEEEFAEKCKKIPTEELLALN